MAKEVVLTVKVDDEEYQKFVKNFNEFSDKLKALTDKFKSTGSSADKAAQSSRALSDNMRNLLDTSNNVHRTIGKITEHFGKWATLIGGTVMMLGAGAGMFGIDRLLNQYIQRQRTALGMGLTTGQTQAALGIEGLVPGSPAATMRNIQEALHGDISKRIGLQALGIDLKKPPEEIYKDVLRKLPEFMRRAPKGFELGIARQQHVTDIVGEEKVLEALQHPEEIRREIEAIERRERMLPKMGPEETRKLEELKNSWNDFTSVVQARLTQGLAAIAPALTTISKGMTKLVPETGGDILRLLANPPAYLASKAAEEAKKRNWGDFLQQYLSTPVKTFKDRLDELSLSIWEVISRLNTKAESTFARTAPAAAAPTGISRPAPGAPAIPGGVAPPTGSPALPGTPGTRTAPALPGSVAPPVPPSFQKSGSLFQFGGNQFASFGGNRFATATLFGGSRSASFNGATRLGFGTGAEGGNPPRTFASATKRAAPGSSSLAMMFDRQSEYLLGSLGGARAPGGRGGLDIDNWQHSRTTNLVVRDVPGSNLNMSATGMA